MSRLFFHVAALVTFTTMLTYCLPIVTESVGTRVESYFLHNETEAYPELLTAESTTELLGPDCTLVKCALGEWPIARAGGIQKGLFVILRVPFFQRDDVILERLSAHPGTSGADLWGRGWTR